MVQKARGRRPPSILLPDPAPAPASVRRFARWVTWYGGAGYVADVLGCSIGFVYHLINRHKKPGRKLAARIQACSKSWPLGPVRVSGWDL